MFKCECGKEFTTQNGLNGHCSTCEIHFLACGKSIDQLQYSNKNRGVNSAKTRKIKFLEAQANKLEQWIAEKHVCATCGKIMDKKYGSGKYCCKSCANTHNHSKETIDKIKKSCTNKKYNRRKNEYEKKLCSLCNKNFLSRYNKTGFCKECHRLKEVRQKIKNINGGYRHGSGWGKHGWYKGYYCDSSWELAYVIYNLENNISFQRNNKKFFYEFEGKTHYYIPDFIEGDVYVEIKGYYSKQWEVKYEMFSKQHKIKVIYKKDIQKYLDYVVNKYGKNFIELYEK